MNEDYIMKIYIYSVILFVVGTLTSILGYMLTINIILLLGMLYVIISFTVLLHIIVYLLRLK